MQLGGAPFPESIMAKKILIVDDSSTQRLASRMLLGNRTNFDIISACDGKEGLETAIRETPDLILMDVEMPRMTGLEACKLLKHNEVTKAIPIILLTMRGEESFVRQGYANGCSEFLTKPMDERKLLAAIKKHLPE